MQCLLHIHMHGLDFSGYSWISGLSFQKAIDMMLRYILSVLFHLSGFKL